MARTYKRDSRGRFAGGGGSSGSSSGGRKRNKAFTTTTGTFQTRQRNKLAQKRRTKAFSSKATAGRAAKEAYKAASGAARKAGKVASRPTRRVDTSPAARRRASESNVTALTRKQQRASDRVSRLQEEKAKLSRDINRRRGVITGEYRDAAKRQLKKVTKSLETTKRAAAEYSRAGKNARTGPVVPMTPRRARARVDTLRRQVNYQRKNEQDSYDRFGGRQIGPKEKNARAQLSKAISSLSGQRVTFRSVSGANKSQRKRAERTLKESTRRTYNSRTSYRSRGAVFARGTSMQGNLLTGGFSRVASGSLRPISGSTASAKRSKGVSRRARLR